MIPQTAGYVFNFERGAYAPDGKIEGQPSQEEIDSHNRRLAQRELEAMKVTGRAVLYLFTRKDSIGTPGKTWEIGTWSSQPSERFAVTYSCRSWHNFAGKDGRLDVWFNFDGSQWHGVNIGDNDIVRCKRTKR